MTLQDSAKFTIFCTHDALIGTYHDWSQQKTIMG